VSGRPELAEAGSDLAGLRGTTVRQARIDAEGDLRLDGGGLLLQVVGATWRIESADTALMGSADDDTSLVRVLEGRVLEGIRISAVSLDAELGFTDGYRLRTFAVHTDAVVHWTATLPDGSVATAGPGGRWSVDPPA
jgi:hypothetical protein